MIIQLPPQPNLAAALAAGPVQRDQVPRYALVLKGAYSTASADSSGIRPMLPEPDASHAAISYADEQLAGEGTGYQVDLSVRKQRCDVVVAGWLDTPAVGAAGMEGEVRVAGLSWLNRRTASATAPPQDDEDAVRNLFGWQARGMPQRNISPVPGNSDPLLPPGYTAAFENVYRRTGAGSSPRFTTPGHRNTGSLPAAAEVEVRQWRHGAADAAVSYRVRSPSVLDFAVQLRAWCGHGPDRERHWQVVDRLALRCDTLVLYPTAHRAVVVWRGDWDALLVPTAHWRKVQVLEGSG